MKTSNLIALVGVSCLLMKGLAVAGDPDGEPRPGDRAEEAAGEVADAFVDAGEKVAAEAEDAAEDARDAVHRAWRQMNARGLTIRNILGEPVVTRDSAVAARIDDILFDRAGRPELALLREGGFFGIGEDRLLVNIARLRLMLDERGEISAEIALSDEELEQLGTDTAFLPTDFSIAGEIDPTLMSGRKIVSAAVRDAAGREIADIHDVVLGPEWELDRVVLSVGGVGALGDRLVAVPWTSFSSAQTVSGLTTRVTREELNAMTSFRYKDLAPAD